MMKIPAKKTSALFFATLLNALVTATGVASDRVEFTRDFAPSEGWVKPPEQPWRQELCLNGRWQFQPVSVPRDWKRGAGIAPELPMPAPERWEATPIKIPSPWNVNTWSAGRDVGEGTPHPYWPSSVYYPSYPARWDGVEMGWLKRTFRVPESWGNRRVVVHFEAIGGHAQVLINGKQAGEHFDRFLPFELDVTDLVRRGADNELLVGVRSMRLFDQRSANYKHMRTPYPPGSTTDNLTGIWQDVFLLGLPPARVAGVFVEPFVDRNTLEAAVTLRNDSARDQHIEISGSVQPWINLAGAAVLDAPEPKWRLDPPAMALPPQRLTLKRGEMQTVTLREPVNGRLKLWSPEMPNLNGLVLTLRAGGETLDRSYTRFGWRQCQIVGQDFLLNGQKVQMFGDLLHPFGPFINSRRYVWAWYRMIKDMHGNAVRPHAQPHPRHYLDLADEMGLLVLDETAMFGSSLQLNFEAPAAWERYAEHYDNLIRRDRNHPSVFGWSWGNELFAIFIYDDAITKEQQDRWYDQLAELGARGRRLDPTRNWFSCDGDEDLRGSLPVWNKHFGHGLPPPDWMSKAPAKPLMVGESGGTYYARPEQLAVFNGERAYESYRGRNEALAIDVYDNVVNIARPHLAFFSPAETAWFGIEHLNLGYHDFNRLPNTNDGVWLKPFAEGQPGVQPERIPPYVCTLNPGWDPVLPLYRPLPMFEAQHAALAPGGPQPCAWDRKPALKQPARAGAAVRIEQVAFAGARDGELFKRLTALGLPVADADNQAAKLLVVDAETLGDAMLPQAKQAANATLADGGTVLVMFRRGGEVSSAASQLLPAQVRLTQRVATSLVPGQPHAWTAGLGLPELYFAEDSADKRIMKCGLDGPLVQRGNVLLWAANTDWSLFNSAPEYAKCAAVVLYEHLNKPAGAALVALPQQNGQLMLSTLDCIPASPVHARFWRALFANIGVRLESTSAAKPAPAASQKQHDLLLNGPPMNHP
jgi:beta-galactosidase